MLPMSKPPLWVIIPAGASMGTARRSLGQRIIQGCSSILFLAGVVIFFQGTFGMVYGALLILLGVTVGIVGVKDPRSTK